MLRYRIPMLLRSAMATRSNKTEAAATQLKRLSSNDGKLLRIGVRQKGCAGQSYQLEYVSSPSKYDEIIDHNGVQVVVAAGALLTIIGSRMDYRHDKLSNGFVFENPNIIASCGCGQSFSTNKNLDVEATLCLFIFEEVLHFESLQFLA